MALPRGSSNHNPILLYEDQQDWGTKPIQFLDAWWTWPGFFDIIRTFWEEFSATNSGSSLPYKLKLLRQRLKEWNDNVFALVPKLSGALRVQDYRPISLIHGVYKIVAKVLALKLKLVLQKIISYHQSAFVSGRQILDCFLIALKILEYHKKKSRGCFLFKVDFEKAFDSVLWRHLHYTMFGMGFGAKWRSWILHCVTNAKVSILLNGSLMEELGNGLHQGDPLSPFIFIMAIEPLCFVESSEIFPRYLGA
ncbi:hypothetical protein GH714_007338 [Hevea brasiliensis]|uniref:Reverse transcriptase domain-containing protein n=1 Tax=Hevea brasiliensis TaxID=3981 RepID=A0A6A6LZX2_HEVBR|nr:hypothetical protein GH714_007338 [Hevea brasiliensis]